MGFNPNAYGNPYADKKEVESDDGRPDVDPRWGLAIQQPGRHEPPFEDAQGKATSSEEGGEQQWEDAQSYRSQVADVDTNNTRSLPPRSVTHAAEPFYPRMDPKFDQFAYGHPSRKISGECAADLQEQKVKPVRGAPKNKQPRLRWSKPPPLFPSHHPLPLNRMTPD